MGDYFVMSVRFNKSSATEFGLIPDGVDRAIDPRDGSVWVKKNLYDWGWGEENGYYKAPLPDYPALLELVLYSNNNDDTYGAAAIILEQYSEELLCTCENMMLDPKRKKEFKALAKVFKLNLAINRCPVLKKSFHQIQSDFARWKRISEQVNA